MDEEKKEHLKVDKISKIKIWFKSKSNLYLSSLILAVVIYRVYWFIKLGNQPLWYDEADYMDIAKSWLGTISWSYSSIRPILFPFIAYIFLLIGLGETSLRIFCLLISVGSIILLYQIGKKLINENVGLMSALLLSVFWSFTFFSYRLLTDVLVAFLWLSTIYFFILFYYEEKGTKYGVLGGISLGLSFLAKFSSISLILFIAFYLVISEKSKIFKNTKAIVFYIASLITVIPFFIFQYLNFGSPINFYSTAREGLVKHVGFLTSVFNQGYYAISFTLLISSIIFLAGLFYSLFYVSISGVASLEKKNKSNKLLFVLLWIFVTVIFFGWYTTEPTALDERYFFVFYPAVFILGAYSLDVFYSYIKRYNKLVGIAIIVGILFYATYQNVNQSNNIMLIKKSSFEQWEQAGLWIKERTGTNDTILLFEGTAEMSYYMERPYQLALNTSDMLNKIDKYHPKYIMVSFFLTPNIPDRMQAIQYIFSNQTQFVPVQSYGPYIDKDNKIPLVIIFKNSK
jgi:4-amino-4-deoxy-L-arabinose transferase-like glycosyltransferase